MSKTTKTGAFSTSHSWMMARRAAVSILKMLPDKLLPGTEPCWTVCVQQGCVRPCGGTYETRGTVTYALECAFSIFNAGSCNVGHAQGREAPVEVRLNLLFCPPVAPERPWAGKCGGLLGPSRGVLKGVPRSHPCWKRTAAPRF
eukprot:4541967-Pyramimonas_sp.AAC.1